ncbi:MAG TPA: hypothetical protein VNV44_05825 [Solirubrobacteraceae bacterium]|nr:hypothetical protein [Solirubrobacteraceae bacterium]
MTLRRTVRSAFALLAALLVVAVTGGCGSSTPSATVDPLSRAAFTTSSADGAKLAMHMQIDLGSLGGQIAMDGKGHVNFKDGESELTMTLNGLPAAASSVLPDGTTIAERFTGGKVYVGSPVFAGKLPNGASWMAIDVAAVAGKLGLDPQSLASGQANPAQFLQYLRASGGSVQAAGTQFVRGVRTTRYTGSIDLRKAASQLPGSSGATKQAVEKLIGQLGIGSMPVQVWVDSHQLVRRIEIDLPLSVGGQRLQAGVVVEFFDFGATPSVHAPAASETYEVSGDALSSGAAGLGG